MNRNILIIVVIVIVLLVGAFLVLGNNASAPVTTDNTNTVGTVDTTPATTTTSTSTSVTGTSTTAATRSFTVTGTNFKFDPTTITVKKGDTVKITFVNGGGTHDLVVDGYNARTKILQGSGQETITFVADKAGSFEYYCSVGTHRQMGMKGTLVVQ